LKTCLIVIFLFPIFLFAQANNLELNKSVNGIITSNEGTYLVIDEGLILIRKTDPYEEYYRRIYKDSTIVNPNTEFKDDFNLNIIPFFLLSINHHRINFDQPLQLGLFIQLQRSNQFNLTPYGKSIVDSLLKP